MDMDPKGRDPVAESMIAADDIRFSYGGDGIVLDGVGLELKRGEILGVLGPNGSGKTTFVKCLNRILEPQQGEILLLGEDLKMMSKRDIAGKVGFVPQASGNEMSAPMVYDVVLMGRRPHASWRFTEDDDEIVWRAMARLDVDNLASRHIDELSSGQLQRVLIARAIAQEADVILLDEPTSNLDVRYQMEVMDLIREIVSKGDVGACAIVHDLDLAMKYCDKVVLLSKGRIRSAGTPEEALTSETIMDVYGVEAYVENIHGRNRVMMARRRRKIVPGRARNPSMPRHIPYIILR